MKLKTFKNLRHLVVSILFGFVLFLGGCGSGGSSDSTSPASRLSGTFRYTWAARPAVIHCLELWGYGGHTVDVS